MKLRKIFMTHSPESLPAQENTKLEVSRESFCNIFDESKRTEAKELFKKIAEEYQAETREYHNFEHIEKMLAFLQAYGQKIKDRIGVKLATYFHDIVYDTKAKDNEEQSAQYAQNYLTRLGISEDVVSHVLVLIRATVKHEVIENDTDSAIFLDADLAILGSSEEIYDKYAARIRKEYSWVPDDQYRIGRKKVLQDFLNRPRIYFTEQAGKELEQQARANIEREIARLS
ncbi:MAG: HD domain-containing protein [Candidatus Moranbacteria bacterium]|nr:HD domain-containing protein [Candidatus Moranbacteria bacterium]